jgi:nicotinamide-nucleotide amidase
LTHPVYSRLSDASVDVSTTILATPGQIEVHLSASGANHAEVDRRLDDGVSALVRVLGTCVFSTDGRTLEAVVGDQLRERQWRIAAAESCTGGTLLGRMTDVPGSSAWVTGGIVAYADEVKIRHLGVSPETLAAHGAVSEPVALAMAVDVRARLGAEVGVGITGIAGPSGGSVDKPVGTVMIAVALASAEPRVRTFAFPGDREAIRRHSTSAALEMVRQALARD